MTFEERVDYFTDLFDELQSTNSIVEKHTIIDKIPNELKEDFTFIIECLNGKHKFGYTYKIYQGDTGGTVITPSWTVKQALEYLLEPMNQGDLTQSNIAKHVKETDNWNYFFYSIVNRELKLGIGQSLLPKDGLSPMLAKKYEGSVRHSKLGYYITEKLDGNRCIASYNGERWIFTSRNGKEMHVDFDMSGLPTEFVYDGEVLSPVQVEMSEEIYKVVALNENSKGAFVQAFNTTSGLINTHNKNKNLVYNIFDIMMDYVPYKTRRNALFNLKPESNQVRILPVLAYYENLADFYNNVNLILDKVVAIGGEGIMINNGDADYVHKRTDKLLKLKQVQTMDMEVVDYEYGTGKYEGMIGALIARCITDDGKYVVCKVGSGLSDAQRMAWAYNPDKILHKIIEVAYFSLSQDASQLNTMNYSLRFPRLKKVREDKNTTSEY